MHQNLVRTLRARGASATWICDADDKCRWLIARAGIPSTHIADVRSFPRLPREHAVDRWLRFAQASPPSLDHVAGAIDTGAMKAPPLCVKQEWRNDLEQWLREQGLSGRPLVLVQAGNRRTAKWARPRQRPSNTKYWPEERWAFVPREARLDEAILYLTTTDRARNVANDLPLHRLLALQERAAGMISVDTGPAHSAAALGCPIVVLFGTADPDLYAPRNPNGGVICLRGDDRGRASMLGISADAVVDAWSTLRTACRCKPPSLSASAAANG